MDDDLKDDLCGPCRRGEHSDCIWSLGCWCAVRRAPDESELLLCDSLQRWVDEHER